jgi:hypothetical protein
MWWAMHDRSQWPEGLGDAIAPLWHEPWGDRQNELIVIGHNMDHGKVKAALDACVLSDEEMAGGEVRWEESFENPWKEGWQKELDILAGQAADHQHDHAHEAAGAEECAHIKTNPSDAPCEDDCCDECAL